MKLYFNLLIISILLITGCTKNDPNLAFDGPSIYSITPAEGLSNTIVVIKGANFSIDPLNDIVKFNNDSAMVLSASDDSLVVTAPAKGTTGHVTVTVDGKTATGSIFTYLIDSVDVYASGNNQGVIYWKNGEEILLAPTRNNTGGAYGISIDGPDIYVVGSSYFQAGLWKNGTETVLPTPDPNSTAEAKAIAISGSDIYVGGSDGGAPVYWKNDVEIKLPVAEGFGFVNAIAVSGNDIYAAGYAVKTTDNLVYWKNGVETILGT